MLNFPESVSSYTSFIAIHNHQIQRYIDTTEMDQKEWINLRFLSYISLKSGLVGRDLQDRQLLVHLLVNKSIYLVESPQI